MLRILVTGAKGQLGSELAHIAPNFPYYIKFLDAQQLDIVQCEAVQRFFDENKFDYCINAAAYTAVDNSEKEKLSAFEVNVKGTSNLAKACAKHNTRFFHISTDFVFDGKNCTPYTENSLPAPLGVYGTTKLQSENEALAQNSQTIVIRTAWLYSFFGNNFGKTVLRIARERGKIDVVYDQVGTPTYAGDLAATIFHIIQNLETRKSFENVWGVYHYSNEGVASWYDFAHSILELTQTKAILTPILSHQFPTLAERPPFSVLDKNKIKTTFDLKIPHWRESLTKCLSEYSF